MRCLLSLIVLSCLALISSTAPPAYAQVKTCLEKFQAEPLARGIAADDAVTLVAQVSNAQKIDRVFTVVACPSIGKARSVRIPPDYDGIDAGDYIIYEPQWIHEVAGQDHWQALLIFAHEVGHFVNGNLEPGIPSSKKVNVLQEAAADRFASCVVARLGGDWPSIDNLINRIRSDTGDPDYLDRFKSTEITKTAFLECGGKFASSIAAVYAAPTAIPPPKNARSADGSEQSSLANCSVIEDLVDAASAGFPAVDRQASSLTSSVWVGVAGYRQPQSISPEFQCYFLPLFGGVAERTMRCMSNKGSQINRDDFQSFLMKQCLGMGRHADRFVLSAAATFGLFDVYVDRGPKGRKQAELIFERSGTRVFFTLMAAP